MAIFSVHHGTIGKTTHRPGTAAAHIRYIARRAACTTMLGVLPAGVALDASQVAAWLNESEMGDRKNARVLDKIMVALPRELDQAQRQELVRKFCEAISQNSAVPWIACVHDAGEDAENPHCHIVVRDRSLTDGKRVLGTYSKGSTEQIRIMWEEAANAALSQAGSRARVDRRSNKERGIPFAAGVHLGAAEKLEARGIPTLKGTLNRKIVAANMELERASMRAAVLEGHVRARRLGSKRGLKKNVGGISPARCVSQRWRETLLTDLYGADFTGHPLARYWRITRCGDGIIYRNAQGSFVDRGLRIDAATGSSAEITAMLQLAKARGWSTLKITGNEEFQRRVRRAALQHGFDVEGHPRAAIHPETQLLRDQVSQALQTRKGRHR